MRRSSSQTAALALALVLGLSGCATTVAGSAKPAEGGATGGKTTSGKTTSGKPSAERPSAGRKTAVSATVPKPSSEPAGDIKITTKKKTEGYESCDLLTPEEVAQAIGAAKPGDKGCVQGTEEPFAVVLFRVSFATYEGEARRFEIGGNTAYEVKEEGGTCTVLVMLTDDPDEITPAFSASVTPIDDTLKPCEAALKIATKGFEKIPNA